MKISKTEMLNKQIDGKTQIEKQRPPNPEVYQSLTTYEMLKRQLYDHFFEGKTLSISNKSFSESYSKPYDIMNNSKFIIVNDKKYQNVEQTYLDIYKNDLMTFGQKVYERISMSKGLKSDELIAWIAKWINTYTRFNHWIYRTFMIIERNSMRAQGHKLYFEGIKILKKQVIDKIYNEAYTAILECIELYKSGLLREYQPLQIVIKYIGIMGFTKFKLVDMVKMDDRFQYSSNRKEGDQQPENPYDTATFKKEFITRLTKDIKANYTEKVNQMMQLSTPQYFEQAKHYIEAEEKTADHFYGFKTVKELVIRNVLEILIVQKAEGLLKSSKSGLSKMMKEKDITNLNKIFGLLKKGNMDRIFFKEFQNYIQAEGEQILNKISSEDEKAMKKETVINVLGEIIQFNEQIQKIRFQIDESDADLQKAQNIGFQGFCNISNKVCNYLAYYADLMLKKDDVGNNSEELISHVGKISKYLYSYDYFMKMHQKLLGLRILYDNFKNQEAEYALIVMLKNEAGLNATSKLSNMISDQKSSETWNIDFQLKNKFSFGFDVMMLTSGSWEINDPKCGKTLVPPQLLKAVEQFELKFLEKMPNRSVSWIFTHGRAIVQILNRQGTKFILVLNNYQMLTLLYIQNNEYKPVKYGDLLSTLKIEDQPFYKNSIMNLLKYGVLLKAGNSAKIQSKTDEFTLNFDFKYKTQKVGCIIIPKYTEKVANLAPQVSAERCILIDAALVKIMKQRKRAPFSEVIIEVQKMCKTFKAEIPQIKLRIQNCQQRQFFERDANDMNILIYKP